MPSTDAEPQILAEGLATCIPASSLTQVLVNDAKNGKIKMDAERRPPLLMEQEITPAEVAVCAPLVPLILSWTTGKGTPMMMMNGTETFNSTVPSTLCRIRSDSDDGCRSTQVVSSQSSCTKESNSVTRTYSLREFCQLTAQRETDDALNSSKYVNIGHSDLNQIHSRRNIYHKKHQLHGQAGNAYNWSRVLRPEVTFPAGAESWPPLLSSAKKEHRLKNINCLGEPTLEKIVSNSSCTVTKHGFGPKTRVLNCSTEHLMLNDEYWPSLEKLCKPSDSVGGHVDLREIAIQPFAQKNGSGASDLGRKVFYKRPSVHLPPILLMVNKDFIVTSPLKENLMLTLALMGRQSTPNANENLHAQILEGSELKRKVLVGQFKAFSSFMHFMLGHDATRVRTESNAGGTSTISECLSVEYFVRRFQAKDIVTEMEVEYCSFNWKKVDYICTVYGQRVGISVTRAMSFPDPKDFSAHMAYRLLHKKLFGLVVARHGVSKRHSFSQCILHVWCETQQAADLMRNEYDVVSQELDIANDVVMVLTVADGYHARPIFYESLLRNEPK